MEDTEVGQAEEEKDLVLPVNEVRKSGERLKENKQGTTQPELGTLDVGAYLEHYGIGFKKQVTPNNDKYYFLEHCIFGAPVVETHWPLKTAIIQSPSGMVTYNCPHAGCANKRWADVRQAISGDDPIARFMSGREPFPGEILYKAKSLFEENGPPRTVAGQYTAIAYAIGCMVDQKQKAYGDSFGRSGQVLRALYPDGIKPDQYGDMLAVTRIIDKLFRVATGYKDTALENPFKDIAGYGILGSNRKEG